jgi:hypothetical protein
MTYTLVWMDCDPSVRARGQGGGGDEEEDGEEENEHA